MRWRDRGLWNLTKNYRNSERKKLYVSRTAVSKWESGRGYPSIDSLREIARFFSVTIDELLSGEEIVSIAKEDNKQRERQLRGPVLGQKTMAHTLFAPKNHPLNLWVLL